MMTLRAVKFAAAIVLALGAAACSSNKDGMADGAGGFGAGGAATPGSAQDFVVNVGDRVFFHSFEAVQMPPPAESVHILEVFAAGVDKWRGLSWVAQSHGIAPDEIACIGDEINDVQMLRAAGCGIAMGNGIEAAKKAARYVTKDNRNDGVAFAIEQLLSGKWQ